MPKKQRQENIRHVIAERALALAAKKGWAKTTMADIARAAKISLPQIHDLFEDKTDIMTAISRMIDRRVLENTGDPDQDIPIRDRLFDIMMERYDALNEYRDGIIAILGSFLCDPKDAVIGLPQVCRSMAWMLEAAGVQTSGPAGAARVAGLAVIHLKILYVWKDDDSPDLSKTMAALDKALERADRLASMAGL